MQREKNGRFKKNPKLEIEFPSVKSLIKYLFIFIVLLPLIYLMVFRYDIMQIIEENLSLIFGSKECVCPKAKNTLLKN